MPLPSQSPFSIVEQPARDPVCGMTVTPSKAAGCYEYGDRKWYFCNVHCLEKFRSDPQKYAGETAAVKPATQATAPMHAAPPAAETAYTCPMHPEIVRNGPGTCPICGMALEPRVATAEEEENPELKDMLRRLWVSAVLTAPILMMAMSGIMGGGGRWKTWVELLLATPIVVWGGGRFSSALGLRSSIAAPTCSR